MMKSKRFIPKFTILITLIIAANFQAKMAFSALDLPGLPGLKETAESSKQEPVEEKKPPEKPFAEIAKERAKEIKKGLDSLKTQNNNDKKKKADVTALAKTLQDPARIKDIIDGLENNIKLREKLLEEKQRLADMLELLSDGMMEVVKEHEKTLSKKDELLKAAENAVTLPDKTYSKTDIEVLEKEINAAKAEAETKRSQIEAIKNESLVVIGEQKKIAGLIDTLKKEEQALSKTLLSLKKEGEAKDKTEFTINTERLKAAKDRLDLIKDYLSFLDESNVAYSKQVAYLKDKSDTAKIQAENAALLAKTKEKQRDEMRRRAGVQKEEVKDAKAEAKITLEKAEKEKKQVEEEKVAVKLEKEIAEEQEKRALEEKKRVEKESEIAISVKEKAAAAEREELAEHKHILAETELLLSIEKEKLLNEKNSLIALKGKLAQIRLDVTTDLASLTQELIRKPEKTGPLEEKYKILDALNSETTTSIDALKKEVIQVENEIKTIEQKIEAIEKKGEQTSNKLANAVDAQTVKETIGVIGKTKDSLTQRLDVTKHRLELPKEKLKLTQELAKFYGDSMKILSPYRKEEIKKITGKSFLELYKNSKVFVHQTLIFFTTLPNKYYKAQDYLSNPDNIRLVIGYIIKIGINIFFWVSILVSFRLYLKRFLLRFRSQAKNLLKKILLCALEIFYSCSIPVVALAAAYISIKILGLQPGRGWSSIILFGLIAYLSYKFISSLAEHLFSTEEALRLIQCKKKTSQFLQKWIIGLAKYTTILTVTIFSANTLVVSGVLLFLLRSIFNIGLLVFFIIFANYWRHEIVKHLILPTLQELETTTVENRLSRFKLYKRIVGYLYTFLVFYVCTIVGFSIAGYTSLSKFLMFSSLKTLGIILIWLAIHQGLKKTLLQKLSVLSDLAKEKKTIISFAFVYSALRYAIILTLGFVALNFILAVWNAPIYRFIAFGTFLSITKRFILIILIIIASRYFLKYFATFIDKLFASPTVTTDIFSTRRKHTISPLLKNSAKYLTFFFAVVLILTQLGVNTTTILAGVGIAGLAIGFGAQTLVKDIITGFFIIFEDSISVGDVVMIGDIGGLVEEVGLRVTKLRTLSGELKIIPNGEISKIGNFNREWMRAIIKVGIAYEGDIDKAMKTLKEIADQYATEHPDIVLEPPEVQGILEFGDSEVTIRVLIKVKPMKHWEAEREMNLRVKKGFDEKGIEIPFPRRLVYHREDTSYKEKPERSNSSSPPSPKISEPEKDMPLQAEGKANLMENF